MSERIIIDRRFNGPPDSGYGGYTGGLLARFIDGPAQVTLRRPPPLDTPLEVRPLDTDGVGLYDGDALVAEAQAATLELPVPEPVDFDEAVRAAKAYPGFIKHPFPGCFGCGPRRTEGDGLRIFPGWVDGRVVVAAPWLPDISLAGDDGAMRLEFVWASLDCAGAWALYDDAEEGRPVVLGRFAVNALAPVSPGERCVVTGWPLGWDGRKAYSGTALFGGDGSLRAHAQATWVRLSGAGAP